MNLTVNGKQQTLDVSNASDLLEKLSIERERVAVVVNENVVRRANLGATPLKDGDIVEIITMVGGG